MRDRICTMGDCDRPLRARGMCTMHWKRWRNHGSPDEGGMPTLDDRLWGLVDFLGSDCWLFNGQVDRYGYGRVYHEGSKRGAHRLVYTMLVGRVAEELTLDHVCRVRRCVNPMHLEVVTRSENTRRGRAAQRWERRAA